MAEEHIEYIGKDLQLIVSRTHTFGTDALLLAFFSKPKRMDRVLDMGSGCGIIPFFWLREGLEARAFAIEIQEKAVEQFNRSIKLNALESRLEVLKADIKDIDFLKEKFTFGSFDLVTMNPPYKSVGHGIISQNDADKIARHESLCSFDDAAFTASKLLRFGGRFCICLKPERLCDAVASMQKYNIEPKRLRFAAQYPGCAPWLLLLEGRFGGKSGMIVEPELFIQGSQEGYSQEMREIIGDYYLGKSKKS